MASTGLSALETAIREVALALTPLRSVSSPESLQEMLRAMGLKAPVEALDPEWLSGMVEVVSKLEEPISKPSSEWNLGTVLEVVRLLRSLKEASGGAAASIKAVLQDLSAEAAADFGNELPKRLLDYLLAVHLERNRPQAYWVLRLLGVVEDVPNGDLPYRKMEWGRLTLALSKPMDLAEKVYRWRSGFDGTTFLTRLAGLLRGMRIAGGLYPQRAAIAQKFGTESPFGRVEVRIPLIQGGEWPFTYGILAMNVCEADSPGKSKGLGAYLFAAGSVSVTNVELRPGLVASVTLSGEMDKGLGLELRPEKQLSFRSAFLEAADAIPGNGSFNVQLTWTASEEGPYVFFKIGEGTRLSVRSASIAIEAMKSADKDDLTVSVGLDGLELAFRSSDGDGFLAQVLPADPISISLKLEYSLAGGLSFEVEGAALQKSIQLNKQLGPFFLGSVDAGVVLDGSTLGVALAATGGVQLGPVAVTLQGVGVEALLDFSKPGLLGRADLDWRLKPPTGAGIAITTGPVRGGGFLEFKPDEGRYSGALQLAFGELALSAIGIITTKLPDGRKGYSLAALIAVEFQPPIALGYGFFLKGVGGLLALNRRLDVAALRAGVKDGSLESLLFPADPVANASRVLSDMERVLPISEGRMVVGPMVLITWGNPAIIEARIGIFIELPAPVVIALLGVFTAILPDKDSPVVELRLDVVGILELAQKRLSIDGALRDSRLLEYPLSGEMALRTSWGDDPVFALAVGGVHPLATVPQLPPLRRVGLSIGRDNVRLDIEGYFALTSNSAQFGARAELNATAGDFAVRGTLSFDTLLYFSPFRFEVALGMCATIRAWGEDLAGVNVELNAQGPTPWHVRGKASIEFLWFEADVNFDKTFGRGATPELPPVDPWEPFAAAVANPASWSAVLPEDAPALVSYRDAAADDALKIFDEGGQLKGFHVLAPPTARIVLKQRVAPLAVEMTRFGNARTTQPVTLDVSVTVVGGSALFECRNATDRFAPGQFLDLTAAERLAAKGFESYKAGVDAGVSAFATQGGQSLTPEFVEKEVIPGGAPIPITRDAPAAPAPKAERVRLAFARGHDVRGRVLGNAYAVPERGAAMRASDAGYAVKNASDLKDAETVQGKAARIPYGAAISRVAAYREKDAAKAAPFVIVPAEKTA